MWPGLGSLCPLQMSLRSYLLLTSPGASDACWIAACRDCGGSSGTGRKQVNPVRLNSVRVQKKPLLAFWWMMPGFGNVCFRCTLLQHVKSCLLASSAMQAVVKRAHCWAALSSVSRPPRRPGAFCLGGNCPRRGMAALRAAAVGTPVAPCLFPLLPFWIRAKCGITALKCAFFKSIWHVGKEPGAVSRSSKCSFVADVVLRYPETLWKRIWRSKSKLWGWEELRFEMTDSELLATGWEIWPVKLLFRT